MSRVWIIIGLIGMMEARGQAAEPLKPAATPLVFYPRVSAVEERIRAALEERTELAFTDTPLTDAVDFLRDVHQIAIIIDTAALQDEGIDPSSPVNIELAGISLRSALRLTLKPLQLTYVIDDEVLQITTVQKTNQMLETRVYPVHDLATDAEELASVVDAIQTGCGSNHWEGKLGASIVGVTRSRALVIRQTQAVHEAVEALLKNLRDAEALLQSVQQQQSLQRVENSRGS